MGSVLSIANLREDLSVAIETADKWVGIFENLYYCSRIMPYGLPHLRAVKMERKLHLWDWSRCQDAGARFENLVASHLRRRNIGREHDAIAHENRGRRDTAARRMGC